MWNGKVIPIYIPCQDYPVPSGYACTHRIPLEEPTRSSHSGSLPEAATVVVFEEENGEGAREWEDL